jgi:YidC/Oxa1 family membrane protein insertase
MFLASVFDDFIVQPIFNLLVFIYAILPGHNFGLAIILFTIVVRLLMWPVVKKQLHQAKAMRKLQPELKRIKKAAAGNKQKESAMLMELYKERGISPFGSLGTIAVQFVILIGLYIGLKHLVDDPKVLFENSYGFIRELPWMEALKQNLQQFDETLFGVVDLTKAAIGKGGEFYLPGFLLVCGSALAQYFQSVQLMPKPKDGRNLRSILRDAGQGKQADQAEVSAAVGRSFRFFIPAMIFIFTINLPAALSLYWMTGGIVAYIQQGRVLGKDEEEMEDLADEPDKPARKKVVSKSAKAEKTDTDEALEGEVIEQPAKTPPKTKKAKTAHKKRRRK